MQQIRIQKKPRRRVRERPAEHPETELGLKRSARIRHRLLRELTEQAARLDEVIRDAA